MFFIPLIVITLIVTGTLTTTPLNLVQADELGTLEQEREEIQEERSDVQENIEAKNSEIASLQKEQEAVFEEMKQLDIQISETNEQLNEKDREIQATNKDLTRLKEEISVVQKRIETRSELLKDRARSYQQTGGIISYIDVILGASSFNDFVNRVSAVSIMLDADQEIVEQHKADKAQLESLQTEQENQLVELEALKKDLESAQASLASQKQQKDELIQSLELQEKKIETEVMSMEEEEAMLAAQEAAQNKAIRLEKDRLEEARRQQQQQASTGSASSFPAVSSGNFTNPTQGVITSGFGPRGGDVHYGLDIAKGGTVPIVAAADGVVIRSYYSSSYGEVVFISHNIDGKQYTTVYAHMRSRSVVQGQTVAKGQQVGIMGNSGLSFGQHLHFELHEGPWTPGKDNAVDPRKYGIF